MKNSGHGLTPMQALRLRKSELVRECGEQEERMTDTLHFAKGHAASLLLGYVFSSITSPSPTAKNISKRVLPVVWSIAKPLLMNVGVKKVIQLVFKKK